MKQGFIIIEHKWSRKQLGVDPICRITQVYGLLLSTPEAGKAWAEQLIADRGLTVTERLVIESGKSFIYGCRSVLDLYEFEVKCVMPPDVALVEPTPGERYDERR